MVVSVSDISLMPPPARRASIQRWRRRSRVIAALRIILPGLIGLILAGLAATVAYNTFTAQPVAAGSSNEPIRLVNPRFVGRDDRGRPFVLIAATATRDPQDYQKVYLDKPALVLDDEGPDPLRITAAKGVYHEASRKLEVSGGVRLAGARGAFETAQSLFDTHTGELVGSGPIQGAGPLGQIDAKSYGVYDKGARMVFKGGVHTRLQPK
ncbi:LPS export ABC transporter periplasmic protein LptC [Phenylobacterium sp.]|uniref:LPS export ABC transporter periplasmic protein LptC n=1 Tax=Phenylobacterium sp. TaxID=1871053 RepID=UPI00356878AE